jgi:hypothetical protein
VKKCFTRPAHADWSYCGASRVKGLSPAIMQVWCYHAKNEMSATPTGPNPHSPPPPSKGLTRL